MKGLTLIVVFSSERVNALMVFGVKGLTPIVVFSSERVNAYSGV